MKNIQMSDKFYNTLKSIKEEGTDEKFKLYFMSSTLLITVLIVTPFLVDNNNPIQMFKQERLYMQILMGLGLLLTPIVLAADVDSFIEYRKRKILSKILSEIKAIIKSEYNITNCFVNIFFDEGEVEDILTIEVYNFKERLLFTRWFVICNDKTKLVAKAPEGLMPEDSPWEKSSYPKRVEFFERKNRIKK